MVVEMCVGHPGASYMLKLGIKYAHWSPTCRCALLISFPIFAIFVSHTRLSRNAFQGLSFSSIWFSFFSGTHVLNPNIFPLIMGSIFPVFKFWEFWDFTNFCVICEIISLLVYTWTNYSSYIVDYHKDL